MKTILCMLAVCAGTLSPAPAQTNDTATQYPKVRFGSVAPLSRYVRLVAITFRRLANASADLRELERYGSQVAPLGYMNAELVQGVSIQVDSLGEWGHLFIRVEPEQEIVKYFGRIKNRAVPCCGSTS